MGTFPDGSSLRDVTRRAKKDRRRRPPRTTYGPGRAPAKAPLTSGASQFETPAPVVHRGEALGAFLADVDIEILGAVARERLLRELLSLEAAVSNAASILAARGDEVLDLRLLSTTLLTSANRLAGMSANWR